MGTNCRIIKERFEPQGLRAEEINGSLWIDQTPRRMGVRGNALHFGVDLDDGQDRGLFHDMRRNRKIVTGLTTWGGQQSVSLDSLFHG